MKDKLSRLFEKYLNNQCSDEEIMTLLEHFKIEEQELLLLDLIGKGLQWPDEPTVSVNNLEEHLDLAYVNVKQRIEHLKTPAVRKIKLWIRIAAAVAIVLVSSNGLYFYMIKNIKGSRDQAAGYTNDLKPGTNNATLTLANGRKIKLSEVGNGELAEEAGISILKSAQGQVVYEVKHNSEMANKVNTLTTAKGETFILILPDKSRVWMNAASSLTYSPVLTTNGVRKVKLEGEAYFEVTKDKVHPFVVYANNQLVEVFGTHFNVNAYIDEPIVKTTLLEGSVQVSSLQSHLVKRLAPGQQSDLVDGNIQIRNVNPGVAIAWKNGEFSFKNEELKSIMRKVARWYNVEVVFQNKEIMRRKFSGNVSRFDKISKVLRILEMTGDVKFKIEERVITVL